MEAMSIPILLLLACLIPAQTPATEKLPLEILYAGNAETAYSGAWMEFLGEHAERVRFVAGKELKLADLAGFDLLVVDGEVESHDANGELKLKNEKLKLTLEELQGFPVVLMGGQGGFFSDELKLKTSWHAG